MLLRLVGGPSPQKRQQRMEANAENLLASPNEPVPQRPLRQEPSSRASAQDLETEVNEKPLDHTQRRMHWVIQVSEYLPIESLAALGDEEIDRILSRTPGILPRAVITGDPINFVQKYSLLLHLATPSPPWSDSCPNLFMDISCSSDRGLATLLY